MKSLFALFFLIPLLINAQNIRPVCDDVGFCWNVRDMNELISYLEKNNPAASDVNFAAGISPHDDYLYAGRVYLPLHRRIRTKEVVIFGVTHGTVRKQIDDPQNILILDEFDKWKGPFSDVSISPLREKIKEQLDKVYFRIDNKAHTLEHSIEAEIPWLQYFNRDIKVTPIMVTAMPYQKMEEISSKLSQIIIAYMKQNNLEPGKDIFFLISSDANHYGKDFNNTPYGEDNNAHTRATKNDLRISETYFSGELTENKISMVAEELTSDSTKQAPLWCGRYSVPFGLLTTEKVIKSFGKILTGSVQKYSDSWTEKVLPIPNTKMGTTAPFSLKHWCGYLSAGFSASSK